MPQLRGEANLAFVSDPRGQQVTARLISERIGIDVSATGNDPAAAVRNLVQALRN